MSCLRWQKAFDLLQQMLEQQMEANVFSFSSLFHSWLSSLSIMKKMSHRTLEANVVTFNAALAALKSQWRLASALLCEMQKAALKADQVTFSPSFRDQFNNTCTARFCDLSVREVKPMGRSTRGKDDQLFASLCTIFLPETSNLLAVRSENEVKTNEVMFNLNQFEPF